MSNDSEKTILIVDDDADIRAIVSGAIEMLGFKTFEAEDGEVALEMAAKQSFDLVVLDLMMPGINGMEVCKELRLRPGGDILPIIMLTAKDAIDDKLEAFRDGVDDYMTKPFQYQELQARVQALLRVRELANELSMKNEDLERMQAELVQKERQLAVAQLSGTAAHQLGQPLSAIMLNCHLLGKLDPSSEHFDGAVKAIDLDARRMSEIIEKLKTADSKKKQSYHEGMDILDLDDES
jgi:DNA-binding response OmpR family regulator